MTSNFLFFRRCSRLLLKVFMIFLLAIISTVVNAQVQPKVGIIISDATYQNERGVVQMTAFGWTGAVNLSGIPYNTLFLEDLDKEDLSVYTALIFTQCIYVEDDVYTRLIPLLIEYLEGNGNLIIDGRFLEYDENGNTRNEHESRIHDLLAIKPASFHGNDTFRISIKDNRHYITKTFENQQFMTQHLVRGLNILEFSQGGRTLLKSGNESGTYPYISVRETKNNRIVLISDFATSSGASSFFRNQHPQVFFQNHLYDVLIRTLHWTVYGDLYSAFPSPQLSNADLTAIIRLDADASSNVEAQIGTINYLTELALETGVVPVYAWVSDRATAAGWEILAPLGAQIEAVGGRIGTHSKFHRIDGNMTEERWEEELSGSILEIESNMAEQGYPIRGVEHFINPGNGIPMNDYEQISNRFSLFMTHGYQESVPLGYGDISWYTGSRNLVVVGNSPSPDYQWFNDPNWSYTTAQITSYQEAIIDHMYQNIGRGVLFNQMWHDYAITTQPQRQRERIVNDSNIAMYDGLKTKFATTDIYAVDPVDLTFKLRAMAQWNYNWESDGDRLHIELDIGGVNHPETSDYIGGMGLRINNTQKKIREVFFNDISYFAFHDDLIILPNLKSDKNTILVIFGDSSPESRLTYISQRITGIEKTENSLEFDVITKSRAKFSLFVRQPSVLLNADWQEWDRLNDYTLRGYVTTDRKLILKDLHHHDVMITWTSSMITSIRETSTNLSIELEGNNNAGSEFSFRSEKQPVSVILNDLYLNITQNGPDYTVLLPGFTQTSELIINFH